MGDLRVIEAISPHLRNRLMVSIKLVCPCGYESKQSEPLLLKKAEIENYLMGALDAGRLMHDCKNHVGWVSDSVTHQSFNNLEKTMTTQVTVRACVSPEKEVKVEIVDKESGEYIEQFTLQHGETADRNVYETREITVSEVLK